MIRHERRFAADGMGAMSRRLSWLGSMIFATALRAGADLLLGLMAVVAAALLMAVSEREDRK